MTIIGEHIMSQKSDYFFVTIKQVYPNFAKPSEMDVEIWEEVLEPYSVETIRRGIKSYRKNVDTGFAPTPAKFREYLYAPAEPKRNQKPELPLCPEKYLMEADIKAGRCRHFFPTYARAVAYVIDVKVREVAKPEDYLMMSRMARYRFAVDNGLFADFERVLDQVYKVEG